MTTTEANSPRYAGLDGWDDATLVAALTEAQFAAVAAVQAAGPALARAVGAAAARLADPAGRLIYAGAGTSGRIAAQDAAELLPTFAWPPARALALIAGGPGALHTPVEGAEDDAAAGAAALAALAPGPADVVIGLAASGRTPWTLAVVRAARAAGALALGLAGNADSPLGQAAEIAISLQAGPEAVAGSTRMKAGTAQKVALNTFSTALMVRLGYVYRGRMVEMAPTNAKLRARAEAMVADLAAVDAATARAALAATGGSIKVAVVMLARGLDADAARAHLAASGGTLRAALD